MRTTRTTPRQKGTQPDPRVGYIQRLAEAQEIKTEFDPATGRLTIFGTITMPPGAKLEGTDMLKTITMGKP